MIKYFIEKAGGKFFFKPRVIVCVPSGVTGVEKRAVIDATNQAGALKTYLIEEPIAAAIGTGVDITEPNGNMIVDIGGGTADLAVISLGGIVVSKSIKIAGDECDEAITRFIRRKFNMMIGERSAEELKLSIGSAYPRDIEEYKDIRGRNLLTGLPLNVTVNSTDIQEALSESVEVIVETIHSVLEKTPSELASDISGTGIILTGGGALLYGMDKLIAERTGIDVQVADDPISCVAIGTGKSLEFIGILERNMKQ